MRTALTERHPFVRVAAWAGLAGPVVFTLVFLVGGALHPGYSHLRDPVSALAAQPYGWLQDLNFFVSGVLTAGFGVGIRACLPMKGRVGSALLVIGGSGLVLAAVFPARDASGAFANQPGHVAAAVLAFLGTGTGLVLLSRALAGDTRWAGLATYALLSGSGVILLFLATGVLAIPPDAPFHSWLGSFQRLTLAVWFPCTLVLALRMLRLTTRPATGGVPAGAPTGAVSRRP